MKEYFFLKGKDQNGPFTVEQLFDKKLTIETLIWTEGMENWQKLKDIPELAETISPKSVPPPPPGENDEKISRTELSAQLLITTEKTQNGTLDAIKPSRKSLTWLIIWCGFHLFALLVSYSKIPIFNNEAYVREPDASKFWPFVEFYFPQTANYGSYTAIRGYSFRGIFFQYDWTEFAFYVGGAIVVFILVLISNKKEETKIR